MNGCMEIAKAQISILMAVYEPRMDWLRQQLVSLNEQTYPNLRLYVRDDCSPTVPYEQILACVRECITRFPCTIARNEENLGSNGTFELLTKEAEGDLFAYCDQDDVWLPEKLAVLQEAMEREQALVVCSDMYIIDGEGRQVADSITKVRRHHVFRSGTDLARGLLTSNFAAGCTRCWSGRSRPNRRSHSVRIWCMTTISPCSARRGGWCIPRRRRPSATVSTAAIRPDWSWGSQIRPATERNGSSLCWPGCSG